MATLDATQQKLLEADPANPNSPKKTNAVAARPGLGFSKSTAGPPKPSLRETMLAQKKATLAAKNLPARPGSAMSSFSPMRTVSTASTSSAAPHASEVAIKASVSRGRPEPSSSASHGGLSVAPMRPTKFRQRPELARPATAGPYSVRRPAHVSTDASEAPTISPTNRKATVASSTSSSPKKAIPRPNTSHSSHASQSSHTSPLRDKPIAGRLPISPRASPKSLKTQTSSPSKADEDFTMVMPRIGVSSETTLVTDPSNANMGIDTPAKSLKVYEDPFSSNDDQTTPRPMFTVPVLEEVPINEDATNLTKVEGIPGTETITPEKSKQNSRLLDSGITKVKSKSLDVHGFRKLQGLIRENRVSWSNGRFDALLIGLFEYLEAPLSSLTPDKVQDVKAQVLATIKLMLKKDHEAFKPHVPEGLRSLLATRSCYDARAHIVSGLELLADELVTLASPEEATNCIIALLAEEERTREGCRTLSMGLHVLKGLLDSTTSFVPSDEEIDNMGKLTSRCLESSDSGVRMEAVQLCVVLHGHIGEKRFWGVMNPVKDDPKSLIMYYIVKRQRESAS
jgi:CLIP-associating protein 1/2